MRRREIRCNGKGKAHRTSTRGIPSEQGKMRFLTLKRARPARKATSNQTLERIQLGGAAAESVAKKQGWQGNGSGILVEVRDHQIDALFSTY
jgi:hypothetical protein